MLVAQIAYSQMNATAKKRANALLKYLPDERKSTSNFKPRPYDFVTAACWMDDVRGTRKYNDLRTWHYINVLCKGKAQSVAQPNAWSAIAYSRSTLRLAGASKSEKAQALAILLHVVGDIHQPLHCIDRDLGGNTFPIRDVPGIEPRMRRDGKPADKTKPATGENAPIYQRLHTFWDMAYRYDVVAQPGGKDVAQLYYSGNSHRPDLKRIKSTAAEISRKYLAGQRRVLNTSDTVKWIKESNALACDFAFRTPQKRKPSQKYFQQAHDVSCRRIAFAGYRLAFLLNKLFTQPRV